ncbi:unnamed protein product, partial [Closterium sp. NIES-53]
LCPSSVPLRVPLPAPPESSLPKVPNPESDRARAASPYVSCLLATANTDPSFESALVAELLDFAPACRLDYATALVAASSSASPPSVGGECALGSDVLEDRVKRPPGSPPAFNARYVARGFSQRQGVDYFQTFSPTPKMTTLRVLLHVAAQHDYQLHFLDFSTAFLQGSLHEEIWLRRPPGFTDLFPAGTQWSLHQPVYGLRQAPREWHDTLRTTIAALWFAPSTADPSLFLRTTPRCRCSMSSSTSALRLPVLLAIAHSLVYRPLALSSTFGRVRRAEWSVPRALCRAWGSCLEDGFQLSSPVTQTLPGSSCEAEIYAGAMAAQKLRRLTYLLTDLGEQPRSPPQCGQLRLAYVATRANTVDIFTKALPPGDHQRLSTMFCLVPTLPHLLTA